MTPGAYTYTLAATAPCASASSIVTVTENAPADAGTDASVTVCDVGAAIDLFAQLGGAPDAGGSWSGPSPVVGSSYDPATMTPGAYVYTVTGTAPCGNAVATVTVTETGSPDAGTDGAITVCGDGAAINLFAQLGGTPDAGGNWSGPSPVVGSSYDPATMTPGAYTYTLAATAPCASASSIVTVTENVPADAGTDASVTVCDVGAAINLFAQLGGAPDAGGSWSGPSPVVGSSYDPATMTPGAYVYTVTGTAPCGNAVATVTVTETGSPDAGTDGAITVCGDGAAINLFAQLGGTPDAGGTWSGPSPVAGSSYDPATMTPGAYTYTLAATAPCASASSIVTVTENVPADAGTDASVTVCDVGAAIDLFAQLGGTPDAGGSWIGPSPVAGSSYDPATMTPGAYVYTVAGNAPCFDASATITVIENTAPDAGGDGSLSICSTSPSISLFAQLTGTPDAGGSWSGPSTVNGGAFDPTTMSPGVYVYSITGSAPCPDASAAVTIDVNEPVDAGTSSSIDLCPGSAITDLFAQLGGTPDPGGMWTHPDGTTFDGNFDPGVGPSGSQTYTVEGGACADATATVNVVLLPGPNAGEDNSIAVCSTQGSFTLISQLLGAPDANGTWTDLSGTTVSATFNPATMSSGVFTYTVAGSSSCPDEQATLTITVNVAPQAGINGSLALCASGAIVSLFDGLGGTLDAGGNWTDPSGNAHGTTIDPTSDAPGNYTYTVVGTAPCPDASATVQVVINPVPVAGEDGSLSICTTAPPANLFNLLGGSPQPGGSWTDPNGAVTTGSFAPGTGLPGTYTYTVAGITPCIDDEAVVNVSVSIAANAGQDGSITLCANAATIDLFDQLGGSPDATGSWTAPNGSASSGAFDPSVDGPGAYTYTVTPDAPCPQVSTIVQVDVVPPAVASFVIDNAGTCVPAEVSFSHDYTGPGSCTWILGNGQVINDCAPITATYAQPGSYDVTLIVDAGNGCGADTVTMADAVMVFAQPTADFTMVPERINTLDPVAYFTNGTIGANGYLWFINDEPMGSTTDLRHEFPAEIGDTYGVCLVALASAQCMDTVCKYITVDDGLALWVPNTFTPNTDDKNEGFVPVVSGIDERFYLFEVYDRWGLRVFQSDVPGEAWDGNGTDGSLAPQDVYVWKVRVKDAYSGERIERIGHVTLLR